MKPISSRSAITLRMLAGERSSPEYLRQRARAHRLAVGDVALDQRLQQDLCALVQSRVVGGHGSFYKNGCAQSDRTSVRAIRCKQRSGHRSRHGLWSNAAMKPTFKTVALIGKYKSPEVAAPLLELGAVSRGAQDRGHAGRADRVAHQARGKYPVLPLEELGRGGRPRDRHRRRRHHAQHRAHARAARRARWSASTRAGSASSPTSRPSTMVEDHRRDARRQVT